MSGTYGGRLVDLSIDEAWELLESHKTGRLAWSDGRGVTVLPLNYAALDRVLWLRTAPYSTWVHVVDRHQIAFEIDSTDEETRSGWSVLLRGMLRLAEGHRTPPAELDVDVWPAGTRILHMCIEPDSVTGKRLMPS